MRMADEQVAPDFHTTRQAGTSVCIQTEARGEQHHVGVGAKHRPGGTGTRDLAPDRGIESLHPFRLGEIRLHGTVDAHQRIEEAGYPAVILGNQALKKLGAFVRGDSDEFAPRFLRSRAPRSHRLTVAKLEHAAVEIEHVRISAYLLN